RIARNYFRLTVDPRMNIFHEDGRMFINREDPKLYDAVLMDAFGSLFSVPAHLTTLEAVTNIHRILRDDGVVIFNLGSAITGKGNRFLNAELQTYREVFPHVLLFKVVSNYPDDRLQNLIIVALKSPTTFAPTSDDPVIDSLLTHRYIPQTDNPELVLTDDLAPVEYYNSFAQNFYLQQR
ncbi:MAG: fused MFS/spermidine synthase, partial [Pyrinomonadaceae bacterium]